MENSIVQFNNPKMDISPYGIEFLQSVSEEEWLQAFDAVQAVQGVIQFYLGDLAVYAESPVTGWGHSKYNELVAKTGYDLQSLMIMATVSRRFPITMRKTPSAGGRCLPWTFFQELASIPSNADVQELINRCVEGHWNREKLRTEIKKVLHPKKEETKTTNENPVFSWPKSEEVAAMDESTETIRTAISTMQQSAKDPSTKNYLLLQQTKKLLDAAIDILVKLPDANQEATKLIRQALELL